jgi:hypothetical protein
LPVDIIQLAIRNDTGVGDSRLEGRHDLVDETTDDNAAACRVR